MDIELTRHLVQQFYETLTDKEFVIFSLHYGFNVKGICLNLTEISRVLNESVQSTYDRHESIVTKLGRRKFIPLAELMKAEDEN